MPQSVSVMMCGHLSTKELDAASLANSIINIGGVSIGLGLSTACDTFFSQTYGVGNKKRMGMYLQRSFMVIMLFLIPLLVFHINIEPVFRILGQDEEISAKAASYILYFLPGFFFDFSFLILSRYLQNQNVVYPPMICVFIANIYNVVIQYIAIYVLGYRFEASAVCEASCMFLMLLLLIVYIAVSGIAKSTWDGWTLEAFYDWGGFIKLAVPGIFLVALEEWSYELTIFLAGMLNDVQLGAQSIIFQINGWACMIPLGLGVAVNIRVGQQIADFNQEGAITSYRVALVFSCISAAIISIVFISFSTYIPKIFTSDKRIISVVAKVIPLFGVYQLLDGVNACNIGVLRGCGRQIFGALIIFLAYYIIFLPIGIPVTLLSGLEIQGMWIVLLGVAFGESVFLCIIIKFQNWNRFSIQAQKRVCGDMEVTQEKILHEIKADEEKVVLDYKNSHQNKSQISLKNQHLPIISQDDLSLTETFDRTVLRQVLRKRIAVVVFCVTFFLTGVAIRVSLLPMNRTWTQLCLPFNNNLTNHYNGSAILTNLPWCNETHLYVDI